MKNPLAFFRCALLACAAFFVLSVSQLFAGQYDALYGFDAESYGTPGLDQVKLCIPKKGTVPVETIKSIVCIYPKYDPDTEGTAATVSDVYARWAYENGVAFYMIGYSLWSDPAWEVTSILTELSTTLGRNDVKFAPLVLVGIGDGCANAFGVARSLPSRVAAVYGMHGDPGDTAINTDIPAHFVFAEFGATATGDGYRSVLRKIKESAGTGGRPWSVAIERGVSAGQSVTFLEDLMLYAETIVPLRYTYQEGVAGKDPMSSAVTLQAIPLANGWRGELLLSPSLPDGMLAESLPYSLMVKDWDSPNLEVAPSADFDRENPELHCWFPTENWAYAWRSRAGLGARQMSFIFGNSVNNTFVEQGVIPSQFTTAQSADASVDTGVFAGADRVDFYDNGVLVAAGAKVPNSTIYTHTYTWQDGEEGWHVLYGIATDDDTGEQRVSGARFVRIWAGSQGANTAPGITNISSYTITQGTTTLSIPFSVFDDQTAANSLGLKFVKISERYDWAVSAEGFQSIGTGVTSGTVASVNDGTKSFTCDGAGWTPGALVGRFVQTEAWGEVVEISANTADSLTLNVALDEGYVLSDYLSVDSGFSIVPAVDKITEAGADTLTLRDPKWTVNQLTSGGKVAYVRLKSGSDSGEVFRILSNTTDTLTVATSEDLTTVLDSGDLTAGIDYEIFYESSIAYTGTFSGSGESRSLNLVITDTGKTGVLWGCVQVNDGELQANSYFQVKIVPGAVASPVFVRGQTVETEGTEAGVCSFQGGWSRELSFHLLDPDTDAKNLSLSVTSDDEAKIPVSNVEFGGYGEFRTAKIKVAGTEAATLTFTVSDGTRTNSLIYYPGVDSTATPSAPDMSLLPDISVNTGDTFSVFLRVFDYYDRASDLTVEAYTSVSPAALSEILPNQNLSATRVGDGFVISGTTVLGQTGSVVVTVKATDTQNQFIEDSFTVTVGGQVPPTISTQPRSYSVAHNTTKTLSVVAGGGGPYTYQWYQGASGNEATPVGTNSASFTTPNLTSSTSYWVKVTNAAGAVNSNASVLTVVAPISVTMQPSVFTQSVFPGQSVALAVNAVGDDPVYQWYRGSSGDTSNPIPGADERELVLTGIVAGGSYWVRVSNLSGSVDSGTAVLTLESPYWTSYHDTFAHSYTAPNYVSVSAPVDSTDWRSTSNPATSGVTTALKNYATGSATGVSVNIAGISTGNTSLIAGITMPGEGTDAYSLFNGKIAFSVLGTENSCLQAGVGQPYTFLFTGLNPNKRYTVAFYTGRDAFATSSKFTLQNATGYTSAHSAEVGNAGDSDEATATVSTGMGSPAKGQLVQWRYLKPTGDTGTSFSVYVEPASGNLLMPVSVCLLEFDAPTGITTQPASSVILTGATGTLSVAATGDGTLSYQWFEGEVGDTTKPVAGATSASYTTPSLTQSTSYWVQVKGDNGIVNSQSATVTVAVPVPEIDILGNGSSIPSGTAIASESNHTDFGSAEVANGTLTRTFTIQNAGGAALTMGSPAVVLSGTNAADFSVTQVPSASVAGLSSTTFIIGCTPSATGVRTATVTVSSDDANESSYSFVVQATGIYLEPEIAVYELPYKVYDADNDGGDASNIGKYILSDEIVAGSGIEVSPSVAGVQKGIYVTIANTGNGTLNVSAVNASNLVNCTVAAVSSFSVLAGGTTDMEVLVTPTNAGSWSCDLAIASNDQNEASYSWSVSGTAQTAGAAPNLTVSNLNDSGEGSLRKAITDATAGQTIGFSVNGKIVLSSPLPTINKNLTIDAGGRTIIIDGNAASRAFYVNLASGSVTATLRGLTIQNGKVSDSNGGAIYANGDNLTLEYVTVRGSWSSSSTGPAYGGGINIVSGTLTVRNSWIYGNKAKSAVAAKEGVGGGIHVGNLASLLMEDSVVEENSALNNGSGNAAGGGIAIDNAGVSVTIARSDISGNRSDKNGGGIAASSGCGATISIEDSTLGENAGTTGGAVYASLGKNGGRTALLTIKGSSIFENVAESTSVASGGGIYLISSGTQPTTPVEELFVKIFQSTISGNSLSPLGATSGQLKGGGIYIDKASDNLTKSPVEYGLGIAVKIYNSTITENAASSGLAAANGQAGGIYLLKGKLELYSSIVAGNTMSGVTTYGPDIHKATSGTLTSEYSLVGSATGGHGVTDSAGVSPFNKIGAPLLGALADNGGLTETHALRPGSPALAGGSTTAAAAAGFTVTFDQRGTGFPRVLDAFGDIGGVVDIGAYEGLGDPTTITDQPDSVSILYNATATLGVAATGDTLSYQWYAGESGVITSPVVGATSASFTTPNLTTTTSYWVRVTGTNGVEDSAAAVVTVGLQPTAITAQPISVSSRYDRTSNLSVTAVGAGLSYQWYVGASGNTASPVGGATTASFTTPSLTATTQYWVRVTGSNGTVDSTAATVTVGSPAPEIGVQGNSVAIVSGDVTPATADHTDFGDVEVGGTAARVFTIRNTGSANLTLSGTPKVAISGTGAAAFSVTALPSSPVAAAGSTTFTVTFTASVAGTKTATLTIANNDNTSYTFAIKAKGTDVAREVEVAEVADGGTHTVTQTVAGTAKSLTYTVQNLGTSALATLTLGSATITNMVNCQAAVVSQSATSLAIGATTPIGVTVLPTAVGAWSFDIAFATNDADVAEQTYNWTASGTATAILADYWVTTLLDTGDDLTLGADLATDQADGGGLSLREAVLRATDGQTIGFAVSGTITLGATVDISKAITIDGTGQSVVVSGNNAVRPFTIDKTGVVIAVTLRALTVQNGLATASNGGAIYCNAEDLILESVTVQNSKVKAEGGTFNGGGVCVTGALIKVPADAPAANTPTGSLTMRNCVVSGNHAEGLKPASAEGYGVGGGIAVTGAYASVSIEDTVVSNNQATGTTASTSNGGGIWISNLGTIATIERCTISGNTSAVNGGGIHFNSGTVGTRSVIDSTIQDNRSSGNGAGISCNGGSGGTFLLKNSTLSGNICESSVGNVLGAGLYVSTGNGNAATANIVQSTFSGNWVKNTGTTNGSGGAIYIAQGTGGTTTVNLYNSTITANKATSGNLANGRGGGIYVNAGVLNLYSSIIAGNEMSSTSGTVGVDVQKQAAGTVTATYNLVGTTAGGHGITNGVNNNIISATPLLGALADNGGLTKTVALQAGSPALNVGSTAAATSAGFTLTYDQRGSAYGMARGGSPDMGSFEYEATTPETAITTQPASVTISSGATTTLTVVATGRELTYQWYEGTSGTTTAPISGATGTSYTTFAANSTKSYWVKVTGQSGTANSNTATVTVSAGGFTDWASTNISDSAKRGKTDDADGDGIKNLMEYALGLNPDAAQSSGLPTIAVNGTNLDITYKREKAELNYIVESSTTLSGAWTTENTRAKNTSPGEVGTNVTVSVPLNSDTKKFLRLRVTED